MALTGKDLLTLDGFNRYRTLAVAKSLGGPMVPAVGKNYGRPGICKVVYCGVASRILQNDKTYEETAEWGMQNLETVLECTKNYQFWSFGVKVARNLAEHYGVSLEETWSGFAWTNLSKLCDGVKTAPPDLDEDLRRIDVAQINREAEILKPDLFLCVAGNALVSTGNEIFGAAPGQSTSSGKFCSGIPYIWTLHPQRVMTSENRCKWEDDIIGRVRTILQ